MVQEKVLLLLSELYMLRQKILTKLLNWFIKYTSIFTNTVIVVSNNKSSAAYEDDKRLLFRHVLCSIWGRVMIT